MFLQQNDTILLHLHVTEIEIIYLMTKKKNTFRQERLRWLGHAFRINDQRIPKQVLQFQTVRGDQVDRRPTIRIWLANLPKMGLCWEEAENTVSTDQENTVYLTCWHNACIWVPRVETSHVNRHKVRIKQEHEP